MARMYREMRSKEEALLLEAYWALLATERFIAPLSNYDLINRIAKRIDRPPVSRPDPAAPGVPNVAKPAEPE